MCDATDAPRRLSWRSGRAAKLWRSLALRLVGRGGLRATDLDAHIRRDIGLPVDGPRGVGGVRLAFDRSLLRRGQPLP